MSIGFVCYDFYLVNISFIGFGVFGKSFIYLFIFEL